MILKTIKQNKSLPRRPKNGNAQNHNTKQHKQNLTAKGQRPRHTEEQTRDAELLNMRIRCHPPSRSSSDKLLQPPPARRKLLREANQSCRPGNRGPRTASRSRKEPRSIRLRDGLNLSNIPPPPPPPVGVCACGACPPWRPGA